MNYLTVIRHGEREGKSEELNGVQKDLIHLLWNRMPGYHTLSLPRINSYYDFVAGSDLPRTHNTLRAFGYTGEIITLPELSESVDDFKAVPWKGSFGEVQRKYHECGPTRELGDKHGRLYTSILKRIGKDRHGLLCTHETRFEAALASLVNGAVDISPLGENLGYVEGCHVMIDHGRIKSVEDIRTNFLRRSNEGLNLDIPLRRYD